MAFVAHARPEAPKWLRQGESFDPAPRGKSDTHTCSLNKGIGCKSRTRKESVAGSAVCTFEIASTRQDSESSCDSKVLFSMREIPACGENRSLEGLSWPGEKAEAMRLRRKRTRSQRLQGFTRMNRSVRRPTKSKTGEARASQQEAAMLKGYQTVCTAKICHKSDDWRNHRFCRFCGSLSLR